MRLGDFSRLLIAFVSTAALASGCESRTGDPQAADEERSELRIVTLAPHLAELVFAVGAGELVVGVSSYTDYPAAAASLPVVGDAFFVDQEKLVVLRANLLLAWASGTPAHVIDELRDRGFRVEAIRTRGLDDVASAIEQVGALTGHLPEARRSASEFREGLRQLAERYGDSEPIRVFYQVSQQPLYTINGEHYVSELIETCGGRNVFSNIGSLAPMVDVEAVLAHDPEVMLASADNPPDVFSVWERWPDLAVNRYDNFFFLPASEIGRATPRLIGAGKTLCGTLDRARSHRAAAKQELAGFFAFHLH